MLSLRSICTLVVLVIMAVLLQTGAQADIFTVTDLADSGPGTLRECLIQASSHVGTPHKIVFDVEGGITLTSPLPAMTVNETEIRGEENSSGPVACDPGDPPRVTLLGIGTAACPGLQLAANFCVITGLRIMLFDQAGIFIHPGYHNNEIGQPGFEGCERVVLNSNNIGIDMGGQDTNWNIIRNCDIYNNSADGIFVHSGPKYNVIGVDADGERNYIYNNGNNGIHFLADETGPVEDDSINGNRIYNNQENGIFFNTSGNDVFNCLIFKNHVGMDSNVSPAGNLIDGIRCEGSSHDNDILDNIINGNVHHGISLWQQSDNDSIAGNFVGVLESGDPMPNGDHGIYIETAHNTIGPDNVIMYNCPNGSSFAGLSFENGADHNAAWHNTISANSGYGVKFTGTGTSFNNLGGNYIGTDEFNGVFGNAEDGIVLESDAGGNTIHHNVVGFNNAHGIGVAITAGNQTIYGNKIGTDSAMTADLGNGQSGIKLSSSNNTIGGLFEDEENIIVNNSNYGINAASSSQQGGNYIVGNFIGTNENGDVMGNGSSGIRVGGYMINNDIGDWADIDGAGNTIMYNAGPGVIVAGQGTDPANPVQNRILTNRICSNLASHEEQIKLLNEGNDDLPAPNVGAAYNAILITSGELIGVVSGTIGYPHPPNVSTRIQVFYDTEDSCGLYYGHDHVLTSETTWLVQGAPLRYTSNVYATETTRGPDAPPEPESQTSPYSGMEDVGLFFNLADACSSSVCPWLCTDDSGGSSSWIDYNNDGLEDLFICNAGSANLLFENLGDYNFDLDDAQWLSAAGDVTFSSAWADYDNDGLLDCYLVNSNSSNKLIRNTGSGFEPVSMPVIENDGPGRTAAWADIDLDGDLDLFLANHGTVDGLYLQDGAEFEEIIHSILGYDFPALPTTCAAFGDYDNDGDPDLYLGVSGQANMLLRNNGDLTFTDVTSGLLGDTGETRAVVWGDFNNDQHLDLFFCNYDGGSKLLYGSGDGAFEDVTPQSVADIFYMVSVDTGDLDQNGHLDLVTYAEGMPKPIVWFSDGLTYIPEEGPRESSIVSGPMGDIDGDGDLDIFTVSNQVGEDNSFLVNTLTEEEGWVLYKLVGTQSNRFGIGARIEVTTGRGTQIREVQAGTGSRGQSSIKAAFGLSDVETIDLVRVYWPSGAISELEDVTINQVYTIVEPTTDAVEPLPALVTVISLHCAPNPFTGRTQVQYQLVQPQEVTLRIYDSAGRVVRTLVNDQRSAGVHQIPWDGRNQANEPVAAGAYFMSLEFGGGRVQEKVMYLK
ncbi:MAG: VCBS repeat-containing protein [Candidatus Eisenbacteria bacterium]|uniref:VCBS repeat-containing protein n=1 Tax=Eiseniibacteriota bacterium TaxID=2212470 RepID=A0A948RX04_UNCEI|nr:VCBS repeat-containing protein [Candidatus Eisenbacteria bacterium]MBU1948112.1 VCBS repeat-containing protein [Candidatus Eisenbacteria bacterium]MBU2692585.1 VCBS repeat-containing protein [Candidatus Eisenbacteria bacterium]